MAAVAFSRLPEQMSLYLLEIQKHYSPEQVEMAIASPHLIWVRPRNRGLPKRLRMKIWGRGQGRCVYCETLLCLKTFTVDHIRPIADGGSNDEDNLTVACRSCNSSKGARPLGEGGE